MILTLTLNPCIDKSSSVEKIGPGSKLRCATMVVEPGGGGINVSKALHELGTDSLALFPSGGHNGNMLTSMLQRSGIRFHAVDSGVETRENWVILETSTNRQYRFTFPGLPVHAGATATLLAGINEAKPSFVVASGSLPDGIDADFYVRVVEQAHSAGARCIVDTSGPALTALKGKNVFLVKPNIGELSRLMNTGWLGKDDVPAVAKQAIAEGFAEVIVVSMGADGAWLVSHDASFFCKAPSVEQKSTVGAGDSMVAGLVYMLGKNAPLSETLGFGVACGTAATMNEGTHLFNKEDAMRFFSAMHP